MNEFEWRRQMRDLRQPLAPQRDLWASIDAVLDDAALARATAQTQPGHRSKPRQRWPLVASLAATVLLAAGIGWRAMQVPAVTPVARVSPAAVTWKPADPRLAGAAIELDAARMELQLALQQAPDSPALHRLLNRTELQQTQLRQQANQAG